MIKKSFLTILLLPALLISSVVCSAQDKPVKDNTKQASPPIATQNIRAPLAFGLEDGTPIKIRITRTISSADAKVDEKVDFEVLEETRIGDVVVIPRGGIAWGTVTEAQHKRRMGRAGKLNVNIDSVRLLTGEKVALRAVKEVKGGGHTGAMTGAIVATSIVFFPAAPFFLFMHGKDITIPKGTEITAYINGDASLDPAKFATKIANDEPSPAAVTPPAAGEPSIIVIKSTPDGADITVDGKFVGTTPSTLRLSIGEHAINIEKSGFKVWTRAMTVSSAGSVNIEATLEKVP
ncbi:MAG TPA: PEGA domain-containing protein [Blastocatellia bacterium]|jgi:hypothetical protein|nr:PEGA domain-containing protein [Blastocatellia bacterium]